MPTFVSAGVYTIERDDSLYAPALSPAIIGIVGTAPKGALDTATLITNEGQLIDEFGFPRATDYGMHAAVEALKEARLLYFIRIAGSSVNYGGVTLMDQGSVASAPVVTSVNAEPFNLEPADTFIVTGSGSLNATLTFTATSATVKNSTSTDIDMTANGGLNSSMVVTLDGVNAQTITFTTANFATDTAATGEEIAAAINAQLVGGRANFDDGGNGLELFSDVRGTGSSIQISAPPSGNNANANLGLATGLQSGTGNVANIDAVTATEVFTLLNAEDAELNCSLGVGGTLVVSRDTTGAATTLTVGSTSTAVSANKINISTSQATGTSNGTPANTVAIYGKTKGSHSGDLSLVISDSSTLSGTTKIIVKYRGNQVEVYDKLWKGTGSAPVGSYPLVATINSGSEDGSVGSSDYIQASLNSDLNSGGADDISATSRIPQTGVFVLSTGNNGDNWSSSTVVGTSSGSVKTGMQIFADSETIPVNLLATPGMSHAAVISAGINICEARGDCLYLVDSPKTLATKTKLEVDEVVKWHNGDASVSVVVDANGTTESNTTQFNSSFAALYFPWVKIGNKFSAVASENQIFIPPSGVVLRTMAYTDKVADPWFAPAGPNRSRTASVLDLQLSSNQGDRDIMQIVGHSVNPITNIVGAGTVIWGQKTLQRAPTALDRVNVRRLLIVAKIIIARAVLFLTFEPNDPVMWRRFINLVQPVFDDIKARRGVFDFRVVADSSTNTSLTIDRNEFVGKIFLQPTKAAEKIIIPFNLVPTGASFEDYAQS